MTTISVWADWDGLPQARLLGTLHARKSRSREAFEFQFHPQALTDPLLMHCQLDPLLHAWQGPQYPPQDRATFGIFSDSSPDRWGRLLMERRLNVTESDNAKELELAREAARWFRINASESRRIIEEFQSVVSQWRIIADALGLSAREQDRMADAFRLAGD